jgi:uncharacterized protein (TIGR02145 family)
MNIHQNNGSVIQLPLNTIDSITYTINNSANLASISTVSATSITSNSAISGGLITSDGGAFVTQRGVCFSTSPFPTTANSIIVSGSGTGSFTSALSGLLANTTYYVRAYATNSVGTAYGIQITFSTTSGIISNPGAGVTFDGYTYSSIVLGNGQEWMSENLRTASYANGDPIQNISNSDQWNMTTGNWPTTGAWAHYNNDSQYENPYGKLYNWYAVNDPRGLAPNGWHIPSDAGWRSLSNYLGGDDIAGAKMKSKSGWHKEGNGTNSSGFLGTPCGSRNGYGVFGFIGNLGGWWSSTDGGTYVAFTRYLNYNYVYINRDLSNKSIGLSVRSLKD